MTREQAVRRVTGLLALAGPTSGATQEEARTAAVTAVRLITEHGLAVTVPATSPVDLMEVARLALRVIELEHVLARERYEHTKQARGK